MVNKATEGEEHHQSLKKQTELLQTAGKATFLLWFMKAQKQGRHRCVPTE